MRGTQPQSTEMTKRMTENEIEEIVRTTFKATFDSVDIVAVHVRPEIGYDGHRIVLVEIIYDGQDEQLRNPGTLGIRHDVRVRVQSDPARDPGFPILEFVTKSDFEERDAAAA